MDISSDEQIRTAHNRHLAETIRAAREAQKISQADLAKAVGKPLSWIRQLESPASNPRFNDLHAVFTYLGLAWEFKSWWDIQGPGKNH